jgi:hypothetical protein
MRNFETISYLYFSVFLIIVGSACKPNNSDDKRVEEIRPESAISNIIRNPVSAEGPVDSVNVAKIEFEDVTFDFGRVKEGEVVKKNFKFTNTGKIPLLINDARSTCGCTVPEWPKEIIQPGQSGEILVQFNTDGRKYDQNRPVSIIANTYPKSTTIRLTGFVEPN